MFHGCRSGFGFAQFGNVHQAGGAGGGAHYPRHFPDGEQLVHARFRGATPHFGVRLGAVRSQLCHLAEHRHAASLAGKLFQGLQRREH